jgi:adenosylmethionine-8-amino-7-oxononanoate aminotransferase
VNDRIVKQLEQGTGGFQHSQTYQGHPVACAAALEVQKIVQEENLLSNVQEMGWYLGDSLKRRLERHKHVGDVRGRGLFWGVSSPSDQFLLTSCR